jgi:glycine/D-amino acid oxidase-like deaminating enzyme
MARKAKKYAVIGGGLTGLAAAYQLQKILQPGNRRIYRSDDAPEIHIFDRRPAFSSAASQEDYAHHQPQPLRPIRLSADAASVRATFAMVRELQEFMKDHAKFALDTNLQNIFTPLDTVHVCRIDARTGTPNRDARARLEATRARLERAGAKSALLTGAELKARYRASADPRALSAYRSLPDQALVLVEEAWDAEKNPHGVSGLVNVEALKAALRLKMELGGDPIPVIFHDGCEVMPQERQGYREEPGGVKLTLRHRDKRGVMTEETRLFDKLILAPGADLGRSDLPLVDLGSYNIKLKRQPLTELRINPRALAREGYPIADESPAVLRGSTERRSSGMTLTDEMGNILFIPDAGFTAPLGSTRADRPLSAEDRQAALAAASARFGIPVDVLEKTTEFSTRTMALPMQGELPLVAPLSERTTLMACIGPASARLAGGLGRLAAHLAEFEMPTEVMQKGSAAAPADPEQRLVSAFRNILHAPNFALHVTEAERPALAHALGEAVECYSRSAHVARNAQQPTSRDKQTQEPIARLEHATHQSTVIS